MIDENNPDSTHKYLVYQLANDTFATPLIEIREVLEYRVAKPIPHTSRFFKGVINIRGEIVGVLDLRDRLNLPTVGAPQAQLVFETDNGPLAAIVDRVHSVAVILEKDVERKPTVYSNNDDREYFMGVGKLDDRLLTIISLRKILRPEQLIDLSGQPT